MSDNDWSSELRAAFARFDKDGSGTIDRAEFDQLLDALGSDMTPNDREIGFALVDKDQDGAITCDELADWWDIVREEAAE